MQDIIHGDIKPENILVVKNNVGQYYAQVTDFGYSTVWRKSGRINLPSSPGWTAPEYPRHGGYLFPEAVQMDVFSFGLVCLWLLFFPSENEVPEVCQEALPGVLEDMAREHPRTSNNLIKVMKMSLQRGFVARAKDFIEICQLLGLPKYVQLKYTIRSNLFNTVHLPRFCKIISPRRFCIARSSRYVNILMFEVHDR